MDTEEKKIVLSAPEHIASIAQKQSSIDRLEDELDTVKANLKLAKLQFALAVRGAQLYNDEQLRFDL